MTVDSETPVGAHPAPAAPASAGAGDTAGRLLARLTALPALIALAFLLVAFPLLLLGWFKPVPVLVLFAVAAAVIVPLGWRAVRGCRPEEEPGRTPWWPVIALLAVAAGFGVDQALFHSQFVIVSRDPASYMEFAAWIQRHGSLPITQSVAPFGGRGTGGSTLQFAGWAFYQVGDVIVPQFMAGLPMVLSVGFWAGGMNAAFLMAPLLGAAGVLTFGGLVGRLVGARWAPVAALALALSLPQEFVSRSTYSEPLAQILFLGGLALLIDALRSDALRSDALRSDALRSDALRSDALRSDALRSDALRSGPRGTDISDIPDIGVASAGGLASRVPSAGRAQWASRARLAVAAPLADGARRARVLAALGGLCLGINFLVRLDGPSDMLLLVPFCGFLWLRRRPQAVPLIAGLVVGLAYGAVDGWFLTRPYLGVNGTSVKEMTAAFAVATVVTVVAVVVLRRRGFPRVSPRVSPRVASAAAVVLPALPVLAIAAFAVRPYVQTDYQKLQDAPFSLHWVYWYAGGPAILAATVAAAVLIRRCLRGEAPDWLVPLLVFGWTSAVFLYQPGITPDQPWGSRRLVPAILPGFFLLATWLAAALTRWVRELGAGRTVGMAAGRVGGTTGGRVGGTTGGRAAGTTARRLGAGRTAGTTAGGTAGRLGVGRTAGTTAGATAGRVGGTTAGTVGETTASRSARWGAVVVAACCALALAVPAAKTTFNLRVHVTGGLRLTADGWAADRMYQGEQAAISGLCAAIPPDSSVLFVDTWDSDGLAEAVRGICDVPVASLMPVTPSGANPKPANVKAVIQRIEQAGRRPVLLAQHQSELNPYPNGTVRKAMTLNTRQDQHAMDRPPTGSWAQRWSVWMWEAK